MKNAVRFIGCLSESQQETVHEAIVTGARALTEKQVEFTDALSLMTTDEDRKSLMKRIEELEAKKQSFFDALVLVEKIPLCEDKKNKGK